MGISKTLHPAFFCRNLRAKIMPKLIMQTLSYNIDIVLSKLLGFRLVSQSQPNLVINRDKGNILI